MSTFTKQVVDGVTPQTTEAVTQSTANENTPFLRVGDRVFKTQEDAIKHINSAQEHIQTLEKDWESATTLIDRQAELLEKASRVDELVSAVGRNSSTQHQNTTAVDKGEIINEAINALEQRQKEKTIQEQRRNNWLTVNQTLDQLYGDKTDEVVQKVIEEHNISLEQAVEMSANYPKVFLKMFDNKGKGSSVVSNISSVRSEAVANTPATGPRKSLMKMSIADRKRHIAQRMAELS